VVIAGTSIVRVVVVPGWISRDVVYGGMEMVVVEGRAIGGKTNWQGAEH
jgi:hypothetical protein